MAESIARFYPKATHDMVIGLSMDPDAAQRLCGLLLDALENGCYPKVSRDLYAQIVDQLSRALREQVLVRVDRSSLKERIF